MLVIPDNIRKYEAPVWRLLRRAAPTAVHCLIAFAILAPLFKPGFIFALDMVFAPNLKLPADVTSSYLFHAGLYLLNILVPADILQKLILLAILVLSGLGAHRMAADGLRQMPVLARPHVVTAVCFMTGLFYMVNPFVYGRFMAGQYAVLLGYALLPWFVRALWVFARQPGYKSALILAAWLAAISIVSIHTVGLVLVIAVVYGVMTLWQHRHDVLALSKLAKYTAVSAGIVLLVSSYWLVPLLTGSGQQAQQITAFDSAHREAFATSPGDLGRELNVLAMQGFWAESAELFMLPQYAGDLWLAWMLVLWILLLTGYVAMWRKQRQLAVFFGVIGVVGWVLALGNIGTFAAPFNDWLAAHVPFFAGYREPHKFASLLVLMYAYCTTLTIVVVFGTIHRIRQRYIMIPVLVLVSVGLLWLPFSNTPDMLNGFNNQLKPRQYPVDWHEVDQYLKQQSGDFSVLYVPWHLYMRYEFAGKIIASPAPKFFGAPIVQSSNPEVGDMIPQPNMQTGVLLEPYVLPEGNKHRQLVAVLKKHNIRYILLAKESDYRKYNYLDTLPGIKIQKDTQHLRLYSIKL